MADKESYFLSKEISESIDPLVFHHFNPQRYPFLLQSLGSQGSDARYDIIFACPQERLELKNQNTLNFKSVVQSDSDFLNVFKSWTNELKVSNKIETHLPFYGGWFVYLGYELALQIEPTSMNLFSECQDDEPIACAVRVPAAILIDRIEKKTHVIVEKTFDSCMDVILADIAESQEINLIENNSDSEVACVTHFDEAVSIEFLKSVERIKQFITDGDVFQVNLSRLWQSKIDNDVTAGKIYGQLLKANPAPFCGLMVCDDFSIMSSSPERLVCVRHGEVRTKPIAGTYPRSNNAQTDRSYSQELLKNEKERAEHIMLIDLERNDLGKICVPGTVKVKDFMSIESYRHVHHIVSTVYGEITKNTTPSDIIRSVFPGGTITGCPKVRCMQIISELENKKRGAYTGSMGYVNLDGSLDFNILIRTLVKKRKTLSFRSGAGIVADSNPQKELVETRNKALGLINSLRPQT